jgi:nucleotide-binding universal stress UspA family protein
MFKRILVPLDGSELGELALPYAEELAEILNSEVDLINVCESEESEHRHMYQLYLEKMAQQVRNHIKDYHAGEASPTAKVQLVVLDGDPAAEIIDYAEKNDISLVVMVSHGRSGIMPWSMGSTAVRVIQRITKPVLFIRANIPGFKARRGRRFSKILVPLDGSENGEAALPYVKGLTSKLKAEVTLLQVVEPGKHVHTVGGLDYIPFPEQELEHLKTEAMQYLEKVSGRLANTKATIRSEVKIGHAAQEIIKFADETNTRLVAISSHGRSGVKRWISGSVAYKVLHAGNTPVLLVRIPEIKS